MAALRVEAEVYRVAAVGAVPGEHSGKAAEAGQVDGVLVAAAAERHVGHQAGQVRCVRAGLQERPASYRTSDGSLVIPGRTLVALMENYQDTDGRIAIPQALHSYLPGLTHIGGAAA